jgi:dienelactone hydrolase
MNVKNAVLVMIALAASPVAAEIVQETIEYSHGDVICEGLLIYDNSLSLPLPGIVIYHQWGGPSDYEEARARMLAEKGYVAFVADVYGQGVRPETTADRAAMAGKYRGDRALMRERVKAALNAFQARPEVDAQKIAAIGYCFGGTAALELARAGASVTDVASIHGTLKSPTPEDAKNITAKVLVQHGAVDPFVPDEEVADFKKEMEDAGVDYAFIAYENAVHSFTDWNAGDDPSTGAAYNAEADKKSWEDLLLFLSNLN